MAGSFSDYLENKILDHVTGKTALATATIYIALSTADPLDDLSGIAEPTNAAYARVGTVGADWNAAAAGAVANANPIAFAAATASWATITHFALYDAITGGNFYGHADLTVAKQVTSGDTVTFAAGDLDITLT